MNKQEFIEKLNKTSQDINMSDIETIIDICINNMCSEHTEYEKFSDYERTCHMSMLVMEEAAELTQAMSMRVRGREGDNYNITEECADLIINVLCTCKLFGITTEELQKAINVKCQRAKEKYMRE